MRVTSPNSRRPLRALARRLLLPLLLMLPAGHAVTADKPDPWEHDIRAYEEADRQEAPPTGGIVFIGSSNIRLWKSLPRDFPHHRVINRGFGGSHVSDSVRFAPRIVVPYRPRLVVLSAGSNDLNSGKTPVQVADDFRAFVETVRRGLPDVRIAFIAIAPSPARWSQRERQQLANQLIRHECETGRNLDYIDLWQQYLGADGQPRPELYVADQLHFNADGYQIRADVVRNHLGPPDDTP